MLTYANWIARFPEFTATPEVRFDIFLDDAVLKMGKLESRWGTAYDKAQAYLVGHLIYLANRSSAGEQGAAVPIRSKEVDEVVVEYAISRDQANNFDALNSTTYGQEYIRYRRIYFSGPRVA
ncbi:MAG: DUF4054 domain-containing protein [Ekhidna sp.]|nr:DUF4054 domain-containing protein [Ekhidna sp.]